MSGRPAARPEPLPIHSRDNPLIQRLRRLLADGAAYRSLGQVWLEGEHLCSALVQRGGLPVQAVVSESGWQLAALRELARQAPRIALLPDVLFAGISSLQSPAALGYLIDTPGGHALQPGLPSVVLDRVQDPGNVGSVLRSAAAFGVTQVLALKGTVALWAPKVLRAGMGAHFGLRLIEGLIEDDLAALKLPLLATSSHTGALLPQAELPALHAWVLGHEGQGLSATLLQRCALQLRIPQPGGEESLNVAAAAAICLYESARRVGTAQAKSI